MAIGYQAWDPFAELDRLQGEINRMFTGASPAPVGRAGGPPVRLYGNDQELVLLTEVPGLAPEEISLAVVGNRLTLGLKPGAGEAVKDATVHRRERARRAVTRTLELPHRVEADRIQAQVKNGMLMVRLPRAEADRPRQIDVKAG